MLGLLSCSSELSVLQTLLPSSPLHTNRQEEQQQQQQPSSTSQRCRPEPVVQPTEDIFLEAQLHGTLAYQLLSHLLWCTPAPITCPANVNKQVPSSWQGCCAGGSVLTCVCAPPCLQPCHHTPGATQHGTTRPADDGWALTVSLNSWNACYALFCAEASAKARNPPPSKQCAYMQKLCSSAQGLKPTRLACFLELVFHCCCVVDQRVECCPPAQCLPGRDEAKRVAQPKLERGQEGVHQLTWRESAAEVQLQMGQVAAAPESSWARQDK